MTKTINTAKLIWTLMEKPERSKGTKRHRVNEYSRIVSATKTQTLGRRYVMNLVVARDGIGQCYTLLSGYRRLELC